MIINGTIKNVKEQFNALNAGHSLKDYVGNELTVEGFVIEQRDNDGKDEYLTVLKTDTGEYIGTLSENIAQMVTRYNEIIGGITPENPMVIEVQMQKSKNDRAFLTFSVL